VYLYTLQPLVGVDNLCRVGNGGEAGDAAEEGVPFLDAGLVCVTGEGIG